MELSVPPERWPTLRSISTNQSTQDHVKFSYGLHWGRFAADLIDPTLPSIPVHDGRWPSPNLTVIDGIEEQWYRESLPGGGIEPHNLCDRVKGINPNALAEHFEWTEDGGMLDVFNTIRIPLLEEKDGLRAMPTRENLMRVLRPSFVLATQIFRSGICDQWFLSLALGEITPLTALADLLEKQLHSDRFRDKLRSLRLLKPESITPDMRMDLLESLNGMDNVRLDIEFSGPRGQQDYCTYAFMEPIEDYWNADVSEWKRRGHVVVQWPIWVGLCYHALELQLGARPDEQAISGIALSRLQFQLAIAIIHEFSHALGYTAERGSRTQTECYIEDEVFAEYGKGWEKQLLGLSFEMLGDQGLRDGRGFLAGDSLPYVYGHGDAPWRYDGAPEPLGFRMPRRGPIRKLRAGHFIVDDFYHLDLQTPEFWDRGDLTVNSLRPKRVLATGDFLPHLREWYMEFSNSTTLAEAQKLIEDAAVVEAMARNEHVRNEKDLGLWRLQLEVKRLQTKAEADSRRNPDPFRRGSNPPTPPPEQDPNAMDWQADPESQHAYNIRDARFDRWARRHL